MKLEQIISKIDTQEDLQTGVILNAGQEKAVRLMESWYRDTHRPYYHLGGWAGTGKTTTMRHLLLSLNIPKSRVALCAYTGKAAKVLSRKAHQPATTIHSLIYTYKPDPRLEAAQEKLKMLREKDKTSIEVSAEIKECYEQIELLNEDSRGRYRLRDNIEADLVICDECSMVGQGLFDDLSSFGVKVLLVGDPGQLQPISKTEKSISQLVPIDHQLSEIVRQENGTDIVEFATMARMGRYIPHRPLQNGFGKIHRKDAEGGEFLKPFDQIICAKNVTRRMINATLRQSTGMSGLPRKGEKVVCRFNNNEIGVNRGSVYIMMSNASMSKRKWLQLEITDGEREYKVSADARAFQAYTDPVLAADIDKGRISFRPQHPPFDYGYALTVHSAQGSEWDNVLVWDDYWAADEYDKWLYTAITRASKSVTIVK